MNRIIKLGCVVSVKKKTRAAHSFFQRRTTHPCEIFFVSKITSWLSSIALILQFATMHLFLDMVDQDQSALMSSSNAI